MDAAASLSVLTTTLRILIDNRQPTRTSTPSSQLRTCAGDPLCPILTVAMAATSLKGEASTYLQSLLNKTLRITTTDTRMFLGEFKCTDSVPHPEPPSYETSERMASELCEEHKADRLIQDRNIILQHTFEYRMPSASSKVVESTAEKVVKNMTSRFLGLVVVPGEYITKIELEQFVSQV